MKRITLEEVARLAGVSRATVSRVINTPESVSHEFRQRVERIISETGYQPNLAARTLASRRSNIIGLILPNVVRFLFADPYFPTLVEGITRACNESDFTLALFMFHSLEEQAQVYRRAMSNGLLDGLIVTAETINNPYLAELAQSPLPTVCVGRPPEDLSLNYVDVDNQAGAYVATSHLLRQGRQRVALLCAPPDTVAGHYRRLGYMQALAERGLTVDERLVTYVDFSQDGGYTGMRRLLPFQPDAVFAVTDSLAVGAMQALQEAGQRVPDDVALVGFDDFPGLATAADPPLTSVRQPAQRSGMIAVEALLDVLENGKEPPRRIILPTELIVRESCGAMRAGVH